MDLPLRFRMLAVFVAVIVVYAVLTLLAGAGLINRMVFREAERRVAFALKTSNAMLEQNMQEARKTVMAIAQALGSGGSVAFFSRQQLDGLRQAFGYDVLRVLGVNGTTGEESHRGLSLTPDPVVETVLATEQAAVGVTVVPLDSIVPGRGAEGAGTGEEAGVTASPTREPGDVMVLESAAPVKDRNGAIVGVVLAATVLNGNHGFVDFVRRNVFATDTYDGKSLGTVTIFQGDLRIATNVIGPDGKRALGTHVSREVKERVLAQGKSWVGPALVVGNWYISAYEPLRGMDGSIIGMMYVGVLKERYDDMRKQAMTVFLVITIVMAAMAVVFSYWLSSRLTRPLSRLAEGAAEVARGDLSWRIERGLHRVRDETSSLARSFNAMVQALQARMRDVVLEKSRLRTVIDCMGETVMLFGPENRLVLYNLQH